MIHRYKGQQMSDTMLMGGLLALTGGFLDAYTYVSRGQVFANAQTGNIVLLGMNLAAGEYSKALRYIIPIAAFAVGIYVVEWVRKLFMAHKTIHWRQIVLAVEMLLLLGVAFLPQSMNSVANCLVSFICALQVQSFRKIRGNALATTMCTGNLRSATELIYHYHATGDRTSLKRGCQYYLIIAIFLLGAAVGNLCTRQWGIYAVLICVFLLLAAFTLMFIRPELEAS